MSYIVSEGVSASFRNIADGTLIQNASADDSFLSLGSDLVPFFGEDYQLYVGANSYITFGAGKTYYSSFSCTSLGPAVMIGAADNSYQRIYEFDLPGVIGCRYEGNDGTSGTVGDPGIVWEVLIFTGGLIQLIVGRHDRLSAATGYNALTDGTEENCISLTLTEGQSYVFEPDGVDNYTVYVGASITVSATFGSVKLDHVEVAGTAIVNDNGNYLLKVPTVVAYTRPSGSVTLPKLVVSGYIPMGDVNLPALSVSGYIPGGNVVLFSLSTLGYTGASGACNLIQTSVAGTASNTYIYQGTVKDRYGNPSVGPLRFYKVSDNTIDRILSADVNGEFFLELSYQCYVMLLSQDADVNIVVFNPVR